MYPILAERSYARYSLLLVQQGLGASKAVPTQSNAMPNVPLGIIACQLLAKYKEDASKKKEVYKIQTMRS